jgi:hypothetical protein
MDRECSSANDSVIRLDRADVLGCHCPPDLEHLLIEPADRDDGVAVLRWSLAWLVEGRSVADVGHEADVDAGRLAAFLGAPAGDAGELLTVGEAARLARACELRLEDRQVADDLDAAWGLAKPHLEAAAWSYDAALRRAHAARDACGASGQGGYSVVGAG